MRHYSKEMASAFKEKVAETEAKEKAVAAAPPEFSAKQIASMVRA